MVLCVFVTRAQLYTTHVHYKSPLSEIASHGNEEKMNYEWAVKAIRVGGGVEVTNRIYRESR